MTLAWLPALGAGLILTIAGGLALQVHQGPLAGTEHHVTAFVAVLALAAGFYLLACRRVIANPAHGLVLVLGVAVAMRALVLTAPAFLSSDLYRYIWDGRVQNAGINPYRYVPADPALQGLRDERIYPHVNRREYAPTIYPPTAQLVFRAVAAISQTPLAIRLTAVGFEALAVGCLLALLRQSGQAPARVLIYAWNPLAVWDFAGNGHVDAIAVGLVALALLCRGRGRDVLTGVVLGAAILVKFLPAVIAPALLRKAGASPQTGVWGQGASGSRAEPRVFLACGLTVVALYAVYADVGLRVFGFLRTYGHEEGLSAGSGIWLLAGLDHLVAVPAALYAGLAAVVLAGLAIAVLRHPPRDIVAVARRAGLLAGAAMVLITPHYSWYFPFLAVFAALATSWALIWLSVAPLLLILDPLHEFFFWPSLIYGPALLLAARDVRKTRRHC